MRILQLSSPSGTLAPRSTECITIQPTPKSVPTVGWIRVVLCQRVDFQPLLTHGAALHTLRLRRSTLRLFGVPLGPTTVSLADRCCITTATRSVNLALQATKTQVWRGSCQDPIPPEFQDKVTLTLSCLGGHLQIHGDTEPSPVVLGEQTNVLLHVCVCVCLSVCLSEHVTWDSIKDLRGTTHVQPPTRFRFALQQAQHAILRAIIHNNPTSLASESAWKALALSSWLLQGRPAVNTSESKCAHFLDARLELFWAEDWSALWAMVRAECDVAPVQNATRRSDKQQIQSRIRKVATLARTGEKGRALATARNAPPVPVTEQIVQEIKSLWPTDPQPQTPVQAPAYSCLKLLNMFQPHFAKCPDSVNQDHLACVRNIGMTSALWRETVTCLFK